MHCIVVLVRGGKVRIEYLAQKLQELALTVVLQLSFNGSFP